MIALAVIAILAVLAAVAITARVVRARPLPPPAPSGHHALLATIVDEGPSATLVLEENGQVRYASRSAARLFFGGEVPPDASLGELVRRSSEPLRRAMAGDRTELLVLQQGDEPEVVQITKRVMDGPDGRVTVITAHPLTDELLHEEVRAYKRLVRVLSHELNNSLAPIASLAVSGQRLLDTPDGRADLGPLLATIGERVEHLRVFLGRYAELARLPRPRCAEFDVARLLGRIATLFPSVAITAAVAHAWGDEPQLEQLLVNLVKNALEAGSPAEDIAIGAALGSDGLLELSVRDRGAGMSPEVMAQALVPFFSTKPLGTGLGLAICREIVEGHGGRLRVRNRADGGVEAIVRIPARDRPLASTLSWALTRP